MNKYVPVTVKKPSLYKTVMHEHRGILRQERHFNTHGLHQAYEEWNESKNKNTILVITTTFEDDSEPDIEQIKHATKTITYKDYEGEIWELEQETSKWQAPDWSNAESPLSKKDIIKIYADWQELHKDSIGIVNIKLDITTIL